MDKEMFLFFKNALCGELTSPLCNEYKQLWKECGDDKRKLFDLALHQQSLPYFIEHCRYNFGLSKDYLLESFKDYVNGKYIGIDVDGVKGDYKSEMYVSSSDVILADCDVLACLWCDTQVCVPKCKSIKMYCGCSSNLSLSCDGYNNITIVLLDDSSITLDDVDENTSVSVYKYSDTSNVNYGKYCLSDKIKVFNKKLTL